MKNSRRGSFARASALVVLVMVAGTAPADRHEKWVEARSPNFIVVTDAGEKQARKTAIQFEQIRAVFRETTKIASDHVTPPIVILAAKDQESLHQLLPEYWVKGHSHPAGLFAFRTDQFYAAIQLDAGGENPYEAIYHEYYHSLTVPYLPGLPLWLSEGLAEFFGHTQITGKDAEVGQPSEGDIRLLEQERLIPLNVLFTADQNSPYYNEQNKTSMFYAESWALTHYLFVGDRMAHRPMLKAYLDAIGQGQTEQQAAAAAFGDLGKLQSALENYIHQAGFYLMRVAAPAKMADADIKVRDLSEAEADAYRGGFFAVRGQTGHAESMLKDAARLDPKCALAYQNLALAEFFAGERQDALASAGQAIALDPADAVTRYLRAYLNFPRDRGNPQVEDDLRQAIVADPDFPPPYGLLALCLSARTEDLPEALSAAEKGVALEPGNPTYQLALAQVLARMRRYDDAQVAGLRARASASSAGQRAEADRFLAYLSRARNEGEAPSQGGAAANAFAFAQPEAPGGTHINLSGLTQATGTVTASECTGGELRLEISTESGKLQVHGKQVGGPTIMAQAEFPADFNACSMKGQEVRVWYAPDGETTASGTMKFLELLNKDKAEK